MAVGEDAFRDVMSRWPSGAALATSRAGEQRHGMIVGSFCSLSRTPPRGMFSALSNTRTHHLVDESGVFAISILSDRQVEVFERFAGMDRAHEQDRFVGIATIEAETGAPIVVGCIAWVDCRVVERHRGASYTIFIGEMVAAGLGAGAEDHPLIWFRRQRRTLAPTAE